MIKKKKKKKKSCSAQMLTYQKIIQLQIKQKMIYSLS